MNTMKKSEIREMANTFVNKYSNLSGNKYGNLSGVEKAFLFEGYVNGVMEVLQKLGVTVEV